MFDGSSHTRKLRALCRACSSSFAFCLSVTVVVAACDDSFDPVAPSELAFSVFGYLDASADTQWIRVMPIRPLKVTSPDELGVTVTLEHLGTGQIIELRDSLFKFSPADSDSGSEGAYVHNFWTPEDIEPGAAYRFTARREGKEPAEAVVEIPHDYEVEVTINQVPAPGETDELRITGVKHLPFLTAVTHFYDGCGGSSVSRNQHAGRSTEDETYLIAIEKAEVTPRLACGLPIVPNRELRIVASEAAWPAGVSSPGALGGSGWASNVTNAAGFLGGVLTKVIPYEECEFQSEGAPVPQYCLLRYNRETTTVSGTVSETHCGDGLLDSVTVQVSEIGRDPARVRTVLSNEAGEFLIGALEAGIPYVFSARAPLVPIDSLPQPWTTQYKYTKWADFHTLHNDTLMFMPGQQVEFAIELQRLTPCHQPPPAPQ